MSCTGDQDCRLRTRSGLRSSCQGVHSRGGHLVVQVINQILPKFAIIILLLPCSWLVRLISAYHLCSYPVFFGTIGEPIMLVPRFLYISPQGPRDPAWLRQVLHSYRHLVPWRHCGRDDWRETPFPGLVTICFHFLNEDFKGRFWDWPAVQDFPYSRHPKWTGTILYASCFLFLEFLPCRIAKVSFELPYSITYVCIILF